MNIVAVFNAKGRKGGDTKGRDYIVPWGFGHLAELAIADTCDEKYKNRRDL